MAFVIADRVRETTTSTGTGSVTLAGAYTSFQTFSAAIGNGNNTYYTIASASSGEWEVGIGTYSSGGNLLSRDTVLASSNGGSLVTFTSGAKDVFVTQPSERSLLINAASNGLFAGNAAFTANGVPYANSTSTLTTGSALTFDGTTFGLTGRFNITAASNQRYSDFNTTSAGYGFSSYSYNGTAFGYISQASAAFGGGANTDFAISAVNNLVFGASNTEQMRLTSTGLGIGTSSPTFKLDVQNSSSRFQVRNGFDTGGTSSGTGLVSVNTANNALTDFNYRAAQHAFVVGASTATAMLLDSSGNLGLGVTPSAWASGWPALQVGTGAAVWSTSDGRTSLGSNIFVGSGPTAKYIGNGFASSYTQLNGVHSWNIAPNNTSGAGATLTATQAMTLDASGNLSIGQTSSALQSGGTGITLYGSSASELKFLNSTTGQAITDGTALVTSGSDFVINNREAGAITFGTSNAERARIDSSGNLLVGTTSASFASGGGINVKNASTSNVRIISGSSTGFDLSQDTGGNTYIYNRDNGFMAFATNNTERARIDASGNLGLGVTPSAWGSGYAALQLPNGGAFWSVKTGSPTVITSANAYFDGTSYKYLASYAATLAIQSGGQHQWYTAPSGTAGNAISFTQAMTLDASGNLALTKIALNSDSPFYTGANISSGSNALGMGSTGAAQVGFFTNNTERARITSGGYFKASDNGTYTGSTAAYAEFYQSGNNAGLLVNTVNASFAAETLALRANRNTTNNSFYAIGYYNDAAAEYKLLVADSGTVTNRTGSYGTISDAKMKTDIVDAGSQWNDIKAIRFRKFKMKNDPSGLLQLGVVAQELEQTSPGLVDEHTDRDAENNDLGTTTKSVKTSVLLMKAAVALQEAMARIEKLEAEVAALKGA